ncbi:extracellular solute-binding protein [Pullulanibacillus sp. KACC 23026]|uniref:extracellular solute-binding protein n=1 Tax=Pullulanibacillus sp. KACC 23026 TaxID=3028315 RepID=UPI0023AFBBC8|nr:extracellular solute-binding protein [Pullulanibacillus sp. KACC 23026]WEG11076.1 extracellular solute-binding protein [Pullulanibacillus sp. KACC 23026]
MKTQGIIGLILVLICSVLLSGCGNSNKTDATASNGKPTLTIFAQENTGTDLNTNSFTKLMEKKFDVNLKFQTTTWDSTTASQKRQISLASGDYPDAYMLIPWVDQFSTNELLKYGKQGVLIPLNDLIKKYAPHIQKELDTNKNFKAMTVSPDGNIYGIPELNECYHCSYPQKMWINSDWLKKLNLSMPKTTQDFEKVLEAFKTKDPNGDGKADEIPLSGSTNVSDQNIIPFLMDGFIYDDGHQYLLMNNGKVSFAANQSGWKQGLEYIHTLYQKGLIDPGAFTQNGDAYLKLGNNANTEILGAGAATHPGEFVNDSKRLYSSNYQAVAPLQGPNDSYSTYYYPVAPGADFVLTNKASKQAQIAAIKIIDYLFTTQGQIEGQFGKEGVDWRKPKSGDVALGGKNVTPQYATIPQPDGAKPDNNAWGPTAQYGSPKSFRDAQVQSTQIYTADGYERRLQDATKLYDGKQPSEVFPSWAVWIDPSVADEEAMLQTNIDDYVQQNTLKFITGDLDINKDWNTYVKGLDKLGINRYLQIMQQSYDKSFK